MLYAVSHIDFFKNKLKTEIIEASSAKDALTKHTELNQPETIVWVDTMPDDIEEIKEAFFNTDQAIDVIEINKS
jgi:hypothetical protein